MKRTLKTIALWLWLRTNGCRVANPVASLRDSALPSLREILKWPEPRPACVFCGGSCLPNDCVVVFTPINDCEHKNAVDGCCSHPKNMTPECHVGACPRLHPRIKI